MKTLAASLALALLLTAGDAQAQTSPNLYNGQVLTAGQWNALFAGKQDYSAGFFAAPYTWTAPQVWTAQGNFQFHLAMTGTSPALTSCGTGPTIIGGDAGGEVTTGTGSPTSCTVTFATAYATAPTCVVQDRTAVANLTSYAVTAAHIIFTTSAASSQHIAYICFGA